MGEVGLEISNIRRALMLFNTVLLKFGLRHTILVDIIYKVAHTHSRKTREANVSEEQAYADSSSATHCSS
jgi:hypothetical protein